MRVSNQYSIDEAHLSEKAEDADYWENAYDFYIDVKDKDTSELTQKQIEWLETIEDGLSKDEDD